MRAGGRRDVPLTESTACRTEASSLRAGAAWSAEADDVFVRSIPRKHTHQNRNPDFPTVVVLVHGAAGRQAGEHRGALGSCPRDLPEASPFGRHGFLLKARRIFHWPSGPVKPRQGKRINDSAPAPLLAPAGSH